MTANEYNHIKNTIWPETLAYACWDFGQTLYHLEKGRVKRGYANFQRRVQAADENRPAFQAPPTFSLDTASAESGQQDPPGLSKPSSTVPLPGNQPPDQSKVSLYTPLQLLKISLPNLLAPGSDLSRASQAFKRRVSHGFAHADYGQDRGEIYLEGWILLRGNKGEAKFEIAGWLDAKTRNVRLITKERWISTSKPL